MNKEQFLAMSIHTELKVCVKQTGNIDSSILETLTGIVDERMIAGELDYELDYECAPLYISEYWCVLHPLSDLTKPIEHKGEVFVPIERILQNSNFDTSKMIKEEIDSYADSILMPELMSLNDALLLIEWHFNLMDENEPFIDVNTLTENPYK